MTYGLFSTFRARDGHRDELVALLLRAADALLAHPDCLLYLVAATEDAGEVAVVEHWSTREAHDASLADPAVLALITEGGPLIAGMGVRTVLDVRGGIGAADQR